MPGTGGGDPHQNGGLNFWNYQITFAAVGTSGNFSWNSLVVSTSTLPPGDIGVHYKGATLAAVGGTAPYTWSATGLPAGLILNQTTGVLSGTPTGPVGTKTLVATVTDSDGVKAHVSVKLLIDKTPTITTASLKSGTHGVAYSATVVGSGGSTPYTWSATGLPAGLTIMAATGVISGTPTKAGTASVKVTLTDKAGDKVTKTYSLKIS